ncbi:MAG TPA: lipid-A-disaccharide synthase [Blastocatellia bacterium]|nr:lipid-A-disaccharide synthase [Blastocatellia bacterium]
MTGRDLPAEISHTLIRDASEHAREFGEAPNTCDTLDLMIVVGEASGDKHGAALLRSLTALYPTTHFNVFGSGGHEMREAGVDLLVDIRSIATIGIGEVLRKLPDFFRAYRKLIRAALSRRPAAVILIDWPDFNMRLARRLHRAGLKTIYYISPQIWAWRRYRINALKRDVDRMLVILPFEVDFYRQHDVAVEYVGHPLAASLRCSLSRREFCAKYDLDPARPIIALLPGSRHSEIEHHLPIVVDAASRLARAETSTNYQAQNPDSIQRPQFVLALASTIGRLTIDREIARLRPEADPRIVIAEADTYNALCCSDIAVVASGTATVEAALAGIPMVIIYRASELNWRLIRPLIHLDTFGMVNLIAGEKIVPELMQHEATGAKIANEVTAILSSPERQATIRAGLAAVREQLCDEGAPGSERAARAVMAFAVPSSGN